MEFLRYEQDQPIPLDRLVQVIRRSMRSRRRDRVAVIADQETLEKVEPLLDADQLDPDQNYHWSGIQRRAQHHWKRVMLGIYEDWFRWFMQHQRFGTFHVLVMVEPTTAVVDDELGGYFDGLLARLVRKVPYKVVVVQTAQQTQANAPGALYVKEALLAMLYGTRLSFDELAETARLAFLPIGEGEALRKVLAERWLWKRYHSRYQLTETGEEFVQGMSPLKPHYGEEQFEVEPLFERRKRSAQRYALPEQMLVNMLLEDVNEKGWVTAYGEWPELSERLGRLAHEEGSIIQGFFWRREVSHDEAEQALTPSPRLLRRILEGMVAKGQLEKSIWFREVGRPTVAYLLPSKAPFLEQRCGQCAFYVGLRRRCKLWWLLNRRIGHFPERWGEYTPHNVSNFELHKMKNSWRISPHSSACLRFLDKKRDYLRKNLPEQCDVCGQSLTKKKLVTCGNCGTRYASLARGVRVYTAYEHEFRARYRELTGREPRRDEEDTQERYTYTGTIPQILEKQEYNQRRLGGAISGYPTVVLFPRDVLVVREESLIVSRAGGKNSFPLKGLTIVDYGRLTDKQSEYLQTQGVTITSVQRYVDIPMENYSMRPEVRAALEGPGNQFAKTFALAMARSAINATQRVAAIAKLNAEFVERIIDDQTRFSKEQESSESQSKFLVQEARIMKGYWACYDKALDSIFARFGPRKKSRFVREHVADPAGRAKGYSAVDAAINYLHQRRLLKCGLTNTEAGLGWKAGNGFLHRRSENSRGMGLLLDLADPVKFADREKLLQAFLDYRLNWRDFNMTRDRKGITYYYPSTEALVILERIGAEADGIPIVYDANSRPLVESYRLAAEMLVRVLSGESSRLYEPFIFEPSDA